MNTLKEGDKAPYFIGKNQYGESIELSQFEGKKIVLYFYPKDNTSGCTAQACNLRDGYEELQGYNFQVIGVSPDDEKSHLKFIEKQSLPFQLIADTEKQICKAYGVWGIKKMYGREYEGVFRTTFLIDENGIIEKIIKKVKTKDHTNQILDLLQ